MLDDQPELELEDPRECAEFGGPCYCNGHYCENLRLAKQPRPSLFAMKAWRNWPDSLKERKQHDK